MLAKGRINFRDVDPSCLFLPGASAFGTHQRADIPNNVAAAPIENVTSSIENPKIKSHKISIHSTVNPGFQNTSDQWQQ